MEAVAIAYEDFLVTLKQEVEVYLGDEYEVTLKQVLKNNGILLDGLSIHKPEQTVMPNIYLNQYYDQFEQGRELDEIVDEIINFYETSSESAGMIQEDFTFEFEEMKDQIIFRVVNYEKNKNLLSQVPYIRVLDLAVTFHCLMRNEGNGIGCIRITKEHLNDWQIGVERLMKIAYKNTQRIFPPVLRPMEEVVADLMEQGELFNQEEIDGLKSPDSPSAMYVLTNRMGINGAACILYPNVLEHVASFLGASFYILPSSIHEVILVPSRETTHFEIMQEKQRLSDMVKEINETQVAREEVLSDTVYEYDVIKEFLKL